MQDIMHSKNKFQKHNIVIKKYYVCVDGRIINGWRVLEEKELRVFYCLDYNSIRLPLRSVR